MRDAEFDQEKDCLVPIQHEHSNSVMLGPKGTDVVDLHVELVEGDGQTVVMSTWDLSEDQRQRVADGAQITLIVFQYPMPPVAVALDGPFEPIVTVIPGEVPEQNGSPPELPPAA